MIHLLLLVGIAMGFLSGVVILNLIFNLLPIILTVIAVGGGGYLLYQRYMRK